MLSLLAACNAPAVEQQIAGIGDLVTDRGETVRACQIGYRTFGTLDAARSNAVLVLTWFQGTSAELTAQIGPGAMIDTSRFFVVAVDALGNGVSSSPSNYPEGHRTFPAIGIRDMVRSQHALLTQTLGIHRLRAVVGISMGGMQAFAWATEYPGFADAVVAIAGSPRATEADKEYWTTATSAVASQGGVRRAVEALSRVDPADALRQLRIDDADFRVQAEAIRQFDLTGAYGGSMERAVAAVRARALVVVSERDEVIDPGPARAFAATVRAELVVLDGRCGHKATQCERQILVRAVRTFLEVGRVRG